MPTDPDSRTRLHGLKVREVSLVDHPANEETFLLIKQLEGQTMLRNDTPLLKAAQEASDKNQAEKAEHAAAEMGDDMGKIAAMAMDYAKALLAIDHSKMAESAEYKSLMAALQALASAASSSEKGMHGEKEEKEDEEKSADAQKAEAPSDEEKKEDEAQKMDHGDKEEKEDEEKAQKADAEAPAPAPEADLSEIKNLLASLQSKLAPTADAQKATEEALAKGLEAITERIDRISTRIEVVEKARGVSRGEGDTKTTDVAKSSSIFAGLI